MDWFSPAVIEELRPYVYLFVDPRTGKVICVGKGNGNRLFVHRGDTTESAKVRRVRKIRGVGLMPIIKILTHGLDELTGTRRTPSVYVKPCA